MTAGTPRPFLLLLAILAALTSGVSVAYACGVFRGASVPPEKQPTLSREKVLIIHDEESGTEHFIREIAFAHAADPFGFVVPVPGKPTVAEVKKNLFTPLRKTFTFEPTFGGIGRGKGSGGASPASAGLGDGGGVTVLSVERIGSFKAFVLAATDEAGLAQWLADNKFAQPTGAKEWLGHYVRMGFYYVALRYDPPRKKQSGGAMGAETIRISFPTPMPYYPYLEPEEPDLPRNDPRLLEVWYAGTKPVIPVCLREYRGTNTWTRPLRAGESYEGDARASFAKAIDKEISELLPSGSVVVQTFRDQKRSRDGFGDILFVPREGQELTPERREELRPLLGVLDRALVPDRAQPEGDQ